MKKWCPYQMFFFSFILFN